MKRSLWLKSAIVVATALLAISATAQKKIAVRESVTLKAGWQALTAWERGEQSGDYQQFRRLLSPNFRVFSHPSVERGFYRNAAAQQRMNALISSREKNLNALKFSNIFAAENGDTVVFTFDSEGLLAGNIQYKGYNAICFVIDNGRVAGFREYFGDVDPKWFK